MEYEAQGCRRREKKEGADTKRRAGRHQERERERGKETERELIDLGLAAVAAVGKGSKGIKWWGDPSMGCLLRPIFRVQQKEKSGRGGGEEGSLRKEQADAGELAR